MYSACLLIFVAGLYTPVHSAPIPTKLIDMSYVLDNDTIRYPLPFITKFQMRVQENNTYDDLYWLQIEEYTSATHIGTHMDAPCHFALGGKCIDDIPMERLVAPAAVVDVTAKVERNPNYLYTIEDFTNWEAETGHTLNQVILLVRSGWGKRWGDRKAFLGLEDDDFNPAHMAYPGMSPEAAQWLVDNRNIYGFGNEPLSLDNGVSLAFESHRILLGNDIFGIENVANMQELPLYGATLYALPAKFGKASGAPARILATVPEVIYAKESHRRRVNDENNVDSTSPPDS